MMPALPLPPLLITFALIIAPSPSADIVANLLLMPGNAAAAASLIVAATTVGPLAPKRVIVGGQATLQQLL